MRVLLVEDDPMVGEALTGCLEDDAYAVDWVGTVQEGLVGLAAHTYDIVLLDLGLPGGDGGELLVQARGRGDRTPVIVLTARSELGSRVASLDRGADDYLVKPFDPAELLARMRAVLRRGEDPADAVLVAATVRLDTSRHEAHTADGRTVPLSRREFAVLRTLMRRPGHILSRAQLEERVYGWGAEVESNAIEYVIHRLRSKLGQDVVRNVRGVGWTVPSAPRASATTTSEPGAPRQ